ncbi:MAG: hypothetical protein H0V45_05810 [Actinobacteria bacterium]|nr:hypothetical protein [Actinomycetota bacterium]
MGLAPLLAAAALATCPAAPVEHGENAAASTLGTASSWIAAGQGAHRLTGRLYSYDETLGDGRVREAPGLVVYAGRPNKIAWLPRQWSGTGPFLVIEGRRLDGSGAFRGRYRRAVSPQFYPSGVTIPTPGCWRLTLRTGRLRWTLHVLAVEPPGEARCDTTSVRSGRNPVDGTFTRWVAATPAASVITAALSLHVPGIEGAAIYVGGRAPDGSNTKVLWLARGNGMPLRLWWTRLDGPETFQQILNAAGGVTGAYPSIPVVPTPGCWLLRVRVDGRGGVIVLRALAP